MKNKILKILSYVLVAVLSATVALGGSTLAQWKSWSDSPKLQQLEQLILERFIGDADQTALEDAAANAMIEAMGDRWSYYISAEDYAAHMEQMNNAYVGIGVTIQQREEGGFIITVVNAGGPAEAAGLLPEDVIVAVAGQSVLEMDASECRTLVRGEEGTTVEITVVRDGQRQSFMVERRTVQTPVATARLLEDGIGLVIIENFDERCYDESVAAIRELTRQGATALIFDVRYNPGGYKTELVKLLDYLLPEGELFHSEDYLGNTSVDRSDAACLELPMAVLVNGSSYSAAEFFAAALSEYEAAVIVGEKTSGKGYFQNTFRLSDGSAVAISTGRYTTPKGVSLEGVGITPDVIVEVDEQTAYGIYTGTLEPADDPQLQAAIAALRR